MTGIRRDLVVLVADKDMEQAASGLLGRNPSLELRELRTQVYVHPDRDSGCRVASHEFLRPFAAQFDHALVMFDLEGCGRSDASRKTVELEVESRLESNGWQDRCAAIAIDPELEAWVWTDSPELTQAIGSRMSLADLRSWLTKNGFALNENGKPDRPKEALRAVLRLSRKRPSAALFRQMAERVSLARCTDSAFQKLKVRLQTWFS